MKNINKIKRLIKSQCACYSPEQNSMHNYCCYKDGICMYFRDTEELPRCKYFEEGVLPLDSDLESEYREERQINIMPISQARPKVKCESCGSIFEANSNRQKHCEKCMRIRNREQIRLRVKKTRKAKCVCNALGASESLQ